MKAGEGGGVREGVGTARWGGGCVEGKQKEEEEQEKH